MKSLLIYTLAAILAANVSAQSEKQKLINKVKTVIAEDPAIKEMIVLVLNENNLEASWGFKTLQGNNVSYFLDNAEVRKGSELRGIINEISLNEYGEIVETASAPDLKADYLCYRDKNQFVTPFIKVTKKETKAVIQEWSEPERLVEDKPRIPEIPQQIAPEQEKKEEAPEVALEQGGNITIINNIYTYDTASSRKEKQPNLSDPSTYGSPILNYAGERYAYRNGQWVVFSTGVVVGAGMSAFLSNRFGQLCTNPGYYGNYGYYGNSGRPYGGYNTYGNYVPTMRDCNGNPKQWSGSNMMGNHFGY